MPSPSPRIGLWAAALLASISLVQAQCPETLPAFTEPLPIPPQKEAKLIPIAGTDQTIAYYEININEFDKVFGDSCKAPMIGYDGQYPGPTIIVKHGQQSVVRFVNNVTSDLNRNSTVHLHGSATRAPWDGWAEDQIPPGWYKDYYYPNYQSARMLWYHDHVLDKTYRNVLEGQAGAYIISNEAEESQALNMTFTYNKTDIPLIISTRGYLEDGKVYAGGAFDVNGQAQPYFEVEPRKYRLRFLNADVMSTFNIAFIKLNANNETDPNSQPIKFNMIASDAGLFNETVDTDRFDIGPAERYEVIIDFKDYNGTTIALSESDIMRFKVLNNATDAKDTPEIPKNLTTIKRPQLPADAKIQNFIFSTDPLEEEDTVWAINNKTWSKNKSANVSQARERILANVSLDTVEQWNFIGKLDVHPVHTHLIDFQVVDRICDDDQICGGDPPVLQEYESKGLKDVVYVRPGEKVIVNAIYGPWDGLYMMHCHNLDHEDKQMIGAFDVQNLTELGYFNSSFHDPMNPTYLAKLYTEEAKSDQAIQDAVNALAAAKPYSSVEEINARLKK